MTKPPLRYPAPIGEAIRAWVKQAGLSRRLAYAQAVEDWAGCVGPQIAAATRAESVTPDGVLRVRVATAAWATELSLMTPRILARVNQGRDNPVRGIRWIAGPLDRP